MATLLTGRPERDRRSRWFPLSVILLVSGWQERECMRCGLELAEGITVEFVGEQNEEATMRPAVPREASFGDFTFMELVIQRDESERLQKALPKPVPVFDVVLDDGSMIPNVAV